LPNLAPRFGFAYDLTGDARTSIRGGFGAFYDSRVISQLTQNTVDNNPFSPGLSLTSPPGPFSDPYRGQGRQVSIPVSGSEGFRFPAADQRAHVRSIHQLHRAADL